jgi:RNA polymerase sigma-70 factor (ECF subfamily)
MNKGRTLASPGWIGTGEEAKGRSRARRLARSADEQVTTYFREHAEAVYRYLAGSFGSEEDAEEVTQEAFLRLYEALSAGERIDNPRGWVVIVARRLMINCVKHDQHADLKLRELAHAADAVMCGPSRTQEEALLDRTRLAALRVALRSLPFTERECLYARAEGLTLQEIGDLLGLDLRRVSEILARSIKKLQKQVDV